jgi:hypothetical protein
LTGERAPFLLSSPDSFIVRSIFKSLFCEIQAEKQVFEPAIDGWSALQHMLPAVCPSFHDTQSECVIIFGDAMNIFRSDTENSTAANPQLLLKLCRDFKLKTQKHHKGSELIVTHSTVESVFVHVAALGCSVLQNFVDKLPAATAQVEKSAGDGLSSLATLQRDRKFISREKELAQVVSVVEAVFNAVAPAPRVLLLLHGYPGLGKSAAAKQGLNMIQEQYAAESCCNGVLIPSIIRGRGAAAVQEDLVRWGRELGIIKAIESPHEPPHEKLLRLTIFLEQQRYVVLIDDADEAGLKEALTYLPPSKLRCSLLVTSQILKEFDVQKLVSAAESNVVGHLSIISVCELQPFTIEECMELMQRFCPHPPLDPSGQSFPLYEPLHRHGSALREVYEELAWLPLAVRFFIVWLHGRYKNEMKDAKKKASDAKTCFDEAAVGAAVAKSLIFEWSKARDSIILAPGVEHSRGLQGTVKLALHSLESHPHQAACSQLLAFLALCPPESTPWSLFDGVGFEQAAQMKRGHRVVLPEQSIGFVSAVGSSCYIPNLEVEAVVVNSEVKNGAEMVLQLKDGKMINVRSSNLLFEGDATAVEMEGHWMLPRCLRFKVQGRVMQQHADGSVSILIQGPYEGCHVRLQGLKSRAELNGCFGHVYGACDRATHTWPVRVTLPSNEVEDMLLKAGNLVCSGHVMAIDGNGSLRAVPSFARNLLTRQRPGAEVIRVQGENVNGLRANGVLADLTDALGAVADAVGSSGLVDVHGTRRLFGMHQLLQKAVRAVLGDAHDDAMVALLEVRCGCMGDVDDTFTTSPDIVAHIVKQIKAATPSRTEWACRMQLRMLQYLKSFPSTACQKEWFYHNALDKDFALLGVVKGHPASVEFRAMDWWRRILQANEGSCQALISEIETAMTLAPDAVSAWDCRIALARAQHMAGSYLSRLLQQYRPIQTELQNLEIAQKVSVDLVLESMLMTVESAAADAPTVKATESDFNRWSVSVQQMIGHRIFFDHEKHPCDHHQMAKKLASLNAAISGAAYTDDVQNDWATVIGIYERALHNWLATVGEVHTFTAATISLISRAYLKMEQPDQGRTYHERAVSILCTLTNYGVERGHDSEARYNLSYARHRIDPRFDDAGEWPFF